MVYMYSCCMKVISKIAEKNRYSVPLILFFIAGSSLAAAFVAEYVFDLKPCILCIYQRIPFAVIVALSLICMMLPDRINFSKPLLCLSGLAFFVGSGIASFHVGVEQKWWAGTEDCGGIEADTFEKLRAMILNAPAVRCDEPQWEFLGITMAGYNVVYSLILGIACFYMVRKIASQQVARGGNAK